MNMYASLPDDLDELLVYVLEHLATWLKHGRDVLVRVLQGESSEV